MHGANRLGGNGVANSTVFGGIAGDSMAAYGRERLARSGSAPSRIERAESLSKPAGRIHELRTSWRGPWDDVGVLRQRAAMERGLEAVAAHLPRAASAWPMATAATT